MTSRIADELRLVADMLRRFGPSITQQQADDLAGRVDAVATALPRGKMVSPDELITPAPPRASTAALASTLESPRVLVQATPRASIVGGRRSSAAISEASSATAAATAPHPPQLTTPTSARADRRLLGATSHSKAARPARAPSTAPSPNKPRVARTLVPEAATHRAAEQREVELAAHVTLLNLLEAAVHSTRSAHGHVFVPVNDEMISVATILPGNTFPPPQVKHLAANSITAGVLTSGVAVHQQDAGQDDNNRSVANLLVFPITRRDGRSLAVLQLANKYGGTAKYTADDEQYVGAITALFAEVMIRYPSVPWTGPLYDPVALHQTAPFAPAVLESAIYETLPPEMRDYRAARLIHRTTNSISLVKRQNLADGATDLGAAPSLKEVDSYIGNLQDCWRRSVSINIAHGSQEQDRMLLMRGMRGDLLQSKTDLRQMTERLRLENLNAGDYHREYVTLRDELHTYLERKRAFSD
jgi:hypothetical protein